MEEKQVELRNLTNEIEQLQNQANVHNQNLELLTLSVQEMRQTVETLEELKSTEPGREILLPLGTGSFIKSTLKKNDRVIIGVGAGFSIEKEVDEAKAIVDKRIQETDTALQQTRERLAEISGRLEDITPRWQNLYRELSEGQAGTI
ncbi:MAG: prefoldin subunit alpha [Theionarchaea archaeon]|nr:prefoldin subunit alpha [Theionarchaea archaeon]